MTKTLFVLLALAVFLSTLWLAFASNRATEICDLSVEDPLTGIEFWGHARKIRASSRSLRFEGLPYPALKMPNEYMTDREGGIPVDRSPTRPGTWKRYHFKGDDLSIHQACPAAGSK